jgi:hypothetical protein
MLNSTPMRVSEYVGQPALDRGVVGGGGSGVPETGGGAGEAVGEGAGFDGRTVLAGPPQWDLLA